jgi:hypothetical protein
MRLGAFAFVTNAFASLLLSLLKRILLGAKYGVILTKTPRFVA